MLFFISLGVFPQVVCLFPQIYFTYMSDSIWAAVALAFIIEGLVPLLFPVQWKQTMQKIATFEQGQIRFVGLVVTLLGLLLLTFMLR